MTAMVARRMRSLARIAARDVAPVVLITVLAVAVGVVRTAVLGVFGVAVALKVVLVALETVAEYAPNPAYRQARVVSG